VCEVVLVAGNRLSERLAIRESVVAS
jgi:hypothetical protein